ncbi:MAG: phosphate acetyltransferase, partial [Coxiellaceae bacterium]|nr:phosphate acetyltransferase [Coxiellaceae bacterium]
KIIIVTTPSDEPPKQLSSTVEILWRQNKLSTKNTLGVILNKINAPVDESGNTRLDLISKAEENEQLITEKIDAFKNAFKKINIPVLTTITWKTKLNAPRVKDIAELLKTNIVHEGEITDRRILHITLCARAVEHISGALKPGTLIITPGDRSDIIIAVCLAAQSGIKIAGLLLTGGFEISKDIQKLCEPAIESGLPVLMTEDNSFSTAVKLQNINIRVTPDDVERIEAGKNYMAECLDQHWLSEFIEARGERQLSPSAFRYSIVNKARHANKTIVLPEGNEPRTIIAAAQCQKRKIAHCILLGDQKEIHRIAEHNGVNLPEDIEIIDPQTIAKNYIKPLVKLRKHKGMNAAVAAERLQDNVMLGTMMLYQGEVDGLVSGAVHTTANTIRPALQIIKTAATAKIVSSVFFMCLPDQVLVYGDCAVNPDPNAEELADIAIQSADSAKAFDIEPRIAMISYSTGTSGSGANVDKVRSATAIVKEKRPDLIIDGPLQYDAALIESVAKSKAPDSPVAGKATVIIFPDLNTGNTTYKAVQRSADVLSIGPMLQGLNKPVNDLSRGATIDDIIYTIAITAVQAIHA